MSEKSASEQIDDIITKFGGWKGALLGCLRSIIQDADPEIVEDIKWRMAKRPEGLPVWTHDGIVCFTEIWKDSIKLIFFYGAKLQDKNKLFNSRLESSTVRAIEFHEGDQMDKNLLKELVKEAVEHNLNKAN